jgi:hypothetical protein
MEIRETAQLLAKAALVDNRQVAPETVLAWHEAIGGISYDVALEALTRHRRTSSDYLMPAHILNHAKTVNAERAHDAAAQIARRALPAPEPIGGGIPMWVLEKAGIARTNEQPLPVQCPHCGAAPRERCTRQSRRRGRQPLAINHPSRHEAVPTGAASVIEGDK